MVKRKLNSLYISALADFIETACPEFDPLTRKQVLNSCIQKFEDAANRKPKGAVCRMCLAASYGSDVLDLIYYVVSFKTSGGGLAEVAAELFKDFERVDDSEYEE